MAEGSPEAEGEVEGVAVRGLQPENPRRTWLLFAVLAPALLPGSPALRESPDGPSAGVA